MKYPSPADIAEMKARGYDSSTIAEAEKRLGRGALARAACLTIENAFAGVELGSGIGLWEAQELDDYADAETCAAYRAKEEKHDWRGIAHETRSASAIAASASLMPKACDFTCRPTLSRI